ncbi:MAG TPA: hydrogen gas-evolving membrane-bound hydrogenase subunit E, partial [Devosiaceae bacterium]|nr:hydrogen gas-evolving membrane-bound hydrogenase subunit E [Devosiaceae bacterium]
GVTAVLLAVLAVPFDPRLGDFFAANSVPLAHGRNIVNVILVDFRGLDTLGEISVVMGAAIAVSVLVVGGRRLAAPPVVKRPPRRSRAPVEAKPEVAP